MKIIAIANLVFLALKVLCELNKEPQDLSSHFHQNDYHVIPERADVISYNKNYIRRFSILTFKYNRTTAVINATMQYKMDLGQDLELITQIYKFASNEYRLFPLRIQLNFCKAITSDIAGAHSGFMRCGNFSRCPLLKEKIYHVCRFTIDESKLPPYIPTGRFMAEMQGMYSNDEVFVMRVYAEVTRPLV